ncbi:bifunctional YncE family protein/alkaline phosphatase family protein [Acidithiobacillus sp.]|uniref:bifunctional YncE family protein/alkaline phosphatase family protein n=1 Tax=Acidithiobacillus sp. TaxID=1872118 RepID=UPI0025BB61D9|nr:bifunctional YncE family protein/alkaline phosphatase family protein [Acidithiobacillus sp.]
MSHRSSVIVSVVLLACLTQAPALAREGASPSAHSATLLSSGQRLAPLAAPGSAYWRLPADGSNRGLALRGASRILFVNGGAEALVLGAGYKNVDEAPGRTDRKLSNQHLLRLQLSAQMPALTQSIPLFDSFEGMALSPDERTLYLSTGVKDGVLILRREGDKAAWRFAGPAIALGHQGKGLGIGVKPLAAGLALDGTGRYLLVCNAFNDSVSLIDTENRRILWEQDLRPGPSQGKSGVAGGEYPFAVVWSQADQAIVSSLRDRELVLLHVTPGGAQILQRLSVPGNPGRMLVDTARGRLYVAQDNRDSIAVVDLARFQLLGETPLLPASLAPELQAAGFVGAKNLGWSANSLAMSRDGKRLYASIGRMNAVAVLGLDKDRPESLALLPTAWSPQDLAVGSDDRTLWVVNNKTMPGPNTGLCYGRYRGCLESSPVQARANQYILQKVESGLQKLPLPQDPETLVGLTRQTWQNNHPAAALSADEQATMAFLRRHIRHVIYVIKENRSYDQVFGDIPRGNGDPKLTEFPRRTTPNQHQAAEQMVLLDNFLVTGEVSGNGWAWSTAGRESYLSVKVLPMAYSGGGGSYDWEGSNRGVNVGLSGAARRAADPRLPADPDLLPGTADVAAPDAMDGEKQKGYLWSAALRQGLSVRNYGFFLSLYHRAEDSSLKASRNAFAEQKPQGVPANPELAPITDVYFRGFDSAYPDFWRFKEWEREFRDYGKQGQLPRLSLVRLPGDHTGSFSEAMDGIDTPERQVADNDYALGLLLERVAQSPFAKDTLIFVLEDDAQDGPDHVDAHRSIALVVGPYVAHGRVISAPYNTLSVLRTISEVLGIPPTNALVAAARPMVEVFDTRAAQWDFRACPSPYLLGTPLAQHFPAEATRCSDSAALAPRHDRHYWAQAAAGMDFSREDRLDADRYNRILWKGLMDRPYPAAYFAAASTRED